jgi:hypothetical protein
MRHLANGKSTAAIGALLALLAAPVDAQMPCDTAIWTDPNISVPGCPNPKAFLDWEYRSRQYCLDQGWKSGAEFVINTGNTSVQGTCEGVQDGITPDCLGGVEYSASGAEDDTTFYFTYSFWDGYYVDGVCHYTDKQSYTQYGNALGCCSSYCNDQALCNQMGHDWYGCQCYSWCLSDGQHCVSAGDCCSGLCQDEVERCGTGSPILLNLAGSARIFDLTSAANGVRFDIDGDGDQDQVAWTERGSLVAFVAMDRNADGVIDDGSELFGNATHLSSGGRAEHGFQALVELDENHDGVVDDRDPAYRRLLVWVDTNHNGLSERSELRGLREAGVAALFTNYRESRRTDANGNVFRYVGRAMLQKRSHRVPVPMIDVIFQAAAPPRPSSVRAAVASGRDVDFCK